MIRLSALLIAAAIASTAAAQDPKTPGLPTACEVRAYYLDKDGKPVDPSEVKATLIFETKDGKSRSYPMTLTAPKENEQPLACRHLPIGGTSYRMAVGTICTDASAPGGNPSYDKPFLKPLPVPIEPEERAEVDKRDAALSGAPYFRTYLGQQAIEELVSVPYTDASIQFKIRDEVRAVRAFTCSGGVPSSVCARIGDDLKTLEKQLKAKDMAAAQATMARIRQDVDTIPDNTANDAARKEASVCCKRLDAAVQAGNRDKALAEIAKLREQCEKCDECVDPSDKNAKPGRKE